MPAIMRRYFLAATLVSLPAALVLLQGCASEPSPVAGVKVVSASSKSASATGAGAGDIARVEIKDIILGVGDEVTIKVYKHDELGMTLAIPADGKIFYPTIGFIQADGRGLREIRDDIINGLDRQRAFSFLPGDSISITVYDHSDLNRSVIVPPSGAFDYPLIGEINAEGKTPRELKEEIVKKLTALFVNPQVTVDISSTVSPARIIDPQVNISLSSMGSQKVYLFGEVVTPGLYTTDGTMDLLALIAKAAGVNDDAKLANVFVVRNNGKEREVIVSDLEAAIKKADSSQNILLQRGDIVYVPSSFIADVASFMGRLNQIVGPIATVGTTYQLGRQIANESTSTSVGISVGTGN